MTNLEKTIINKINEGGSVWDVIEIAQKYGNEHLRDRVLDNILKWGMDKIKEKPKRLFYGDNTKLLPLAESFIGNNDISIHEPAGVGEKYDTIMDVALDGGVEGFNVYLEKVYNREPITTIRQLTLSARQWNTIARKQTKQLTINLQKICNHIGINLPNCDAVVDIPSGLCCLNNNSHTVKIIVVE